MMSGVAAGWVRKMLLSIMLYTFVLCASAQSTNEVNTSDLDNLYPLPKEYGSLSYEEQVRALQARLQRNPSVAEKYRLMREIAIQHYQNGEIKHILPICESNPPQSFDLHFRLLCIDVSDADYQDIIEVLLLLYNDALEKGNIEVAVQSLSYLAWKQSSNGDIDDAFQSYEQALLHAEHVSTPVLNDITLNLATLYIMYGDEKYKNRGIALNEEVIRRLRTFRKKESEPTEYVEEVLQNIYFNLGVAYTLHLFNFDKALKWFDLVDNEDPELIQSVLVFSSLAHAELGEIAQATEKLQRSFKVPESELFKTDYLKCYQQIIQIKLKLSKQIEHCLQLKESTPLEVKLDVYSRMVEADHMSLRDAGLSAFYELYTEVLRPKLQLKSIKSASNAELSRLQQESKLKGKLIEKERELKRAEQEKGASQTQLAFAISTILLLILMIIILQLRQKHKLAIQFEEMSLRDRLTSLYNRRYFEQNIERELKIAKRVNREHLNHSLGIYLFDIDHFKKINDNYGHEIGDRVLIEFSRRVNMSTRDTDILVRWGGEEFVLVSRFQGIHDFHLLADRILESINREEFDLGDNLTLNVSCTVGAMHYPFYTRATQDDTDWHQLIQLADAALYMGKSKQRNCWVCIDHISAAAEISEISSQDLEVSVKKNNVTISTSLKTN
ncbi:diguanylate cyclase [Alteromonas macleodii]|uniref:GGDEF domain-containing protein n=1 Tax=Alteromonas macleodii TaxID=28108 RepID=UPI0031400D7D